MNDYAMMGGISGNEALDRALKQQGAAQQARTYDQQTTLGGGVAAGLNVTKPVTLSATLGELNMRLQKLAEITSEVADRVRGHSRRMKALRNWSVVLMPAISTRWHLACCAPPIALSATSCALLTLCREAA